MTNPIIFFGTENFSATSLQALIDAQYTIAAVVTKPDTRKGRGRQYVPPLVKTIALAHSIPVWQPANLADITDDIQKLRPVTGVLVSFGKIIPQSIIDLFTPGIINVHPSKLPLLRGPSPIETTLLEGITSTGVSLMHLVAKMDAGPVYTFTPHTLGGTETQQEAYDTLADVGAKALVASLPAILDGSLIPTPQDETLATYCHRITKAAGIIDWEKPAAQIEREIRAYAGWPGSKTVLHGASVTITKARLSTEPELLSIRCGDGAYLTIDMLTPAGKKEMPSRAFLSGYQNNAPLHPEN